MMFHFNCFASLLSAVTMAATSASAPTHASESRHLIDDTKNDGGGPMDATGDRNPFVPSKIAESYDPQLDVDKKDMVLSLHPRPIFPGKEEKVQAGTLRNKPETASDRNQTANTSSTPFDPSLDLGILDRKRVSNDRSVQPRKLDVLDCNGYHPLIPAEVDIAAFRLLIEYCKDEDSDQSNFDDFYDYCCFGSNCICYSGSCPYDGPIGCWNTSLVTDMSYAFIYQRAFNEDISAWKTSSVTRMVNMFNDARKFNQPVDSWDVSSVTNMRGMFYNAYGFSQPVDSWDVSSVTNMQGMFQQASQFNQPVDSWNVSSVTNMKKMFQYAFDFNQPVDSWDLSSVIKISNLFTAAIKFNQPVDSWDVSSVTNMRGMFVFAEEFNQPVDSWDVSSVTNMRSMFINADKFNQPVDSWDVSSVTSMMEMFPEAFAFNQPVDSWDVSSVTNMRGMFWRTTKFNQPVDSWNVSSVTNMERVFEGANKFNQPVDSWDLSSVSNMFRMFYAATDFNQCLSTWAYKVPPAVNTRGMFEATSCPNIGSKVGSGSLYVPDPNGPWCQDADVCINPNPSINPRVW